MKLKTLFLILSMIFIFCRCAKSLVLTGPIIDLPESRCIFSWGDGIHNLEHEWSLRAYYNSGWFYGSDYSWSNADVYVYSGLSDITTIADASVFPYVKSHAVAAYEGDYVFFRGVNGYYGAWRIDDVYPSSAPGVPYAYLNGQWYFQDDGTACFIPEPATILLLGLVGLVLLKKRRVQIYPNTAGAFKEGSEKG